MSVTTELPKILLTDHMGPSQRLRVDVAQTGFFAGRMFRTFMELAVPVAGPAQSLRFTATQDFILFFQEADLTQGALRIEVFTGATPAGVWTPLPVIGVNRMSERPTPYYTATSTVETGGSFTGGTASDLTLLRSASNLGTSASSNVNSTSSERGLPAGVYYIRFSTLTGGVAVTDAAQGTFSLVWEERIP